MWDHLGKREKLDLGSTKCFIAYKWVTDLVLAGLVFWNPGECDWRVVALGVTGREGWV